jgi:hypothetical protein
MVACIIIIQSPLNFLLNQIWIYRNKTRRKRSEENNGYGEKEWREMVEVSSSLLIKIKLKTVCWRRSCQLGQLMRRDSTTVLSKLLYTRYQRNLLDETSYAEQKSDNLRLSESLVFCTLSSI